MPKTDHDMIVEMHNDIGYIKENLQLLDRKFSDINSKITLLENWKNKVNGALVVFGVLVGGAWAKLERLF